MGIAYLPEAREIVINTSVFDSTVTGTWLRAEDGSEGWSGVLSLDERAFARVIPPEEGDWILILEAVSENESDDSGA
mgnify:CR=1 FL=1